MIKSKNPGSMLFLQQPDILDPKQMMNLDALIITLDSTVYPLVSALPLILLLIFLYWLELDIFLMPWEDVVRLALTK